MGEFRSFEVSRVSGVSMALVVSKFGWSFKISGVSEFQGFLETLASFEVLKFQEVQEF